MQGSHEEDYKNRVAEIARKNGYFNIRVLEDGVVACFPLIFTTAICAALNESGYESRYCFKSKDKALEQCDAMKSVDDIPQGFIAQR